MLDMRHAADQIAPRTMKEQGRRSAGFPRRHVPRVHYVTVRMVQVEGLDFSRRRVEWKAGSGRASLENRVALPLVQRGATGGGDHKQNEKHKKNAQRIPHELPQEPR